MAEWRRVRQYLRASASSLSMASEDDDLIEVVIVLVIVSQECDAQLERHAVKR